jgi:hypothetical protein
LTSKVSHCYNEKTPGVSTHRGSHDHAIEEYRMNDAIISPETEKINLVVTMDTTWEEIEEHVGEENMELVSTAIELFSGLF